MTTALHLVDKSALEQRHQRPEARAILERLLAEGALATCEIIDLEVLFSARNAQDYERLAEGLAALPQLAVTNEVLRKALAVQRQLAGRGQHRLPIPDLIVAATAELNDATVLHHDKDFDLIAAVTGQATRWIVPPGSKA